MTGLKRGIRPFVLSSVFLFFSLLFFSYAHAQEQHDKEKCNIKKSKEAAGVYIGLVDSTLENVLEKTPPYAALGVCSKQAPRFAEILSESRNMVIKRFGLKKRNHEIKLDDWEKKILKQFNAQKEESDPDTVLEYHENVEDVFRYARGIYMKKACLACHGTDLDPLVAKKIKREYAQDEATGFSEGALMGIISVKIYNDEEHKD